MPPNQSRLRDILFFLLVLFYEFNRIVIHVLIIGIYSIIDKRIFLHFFNLVLSNTSFACSFMAFFFNNSRSSLMSSSSIFFLLFFWTLAFARSLLRHSSKSQASLNFSSFLVQKSPRLDLLCLI